jgi:hypothetical protein
MTKRVKHAIHINRPGGPFPGWENVWDCADAFVLAPTVWAVGIRVRQVVQGAVNGWGM